jgi:hypothetical protein
MRRSFLFRALSLGSRRSLSARGQRASTFAGMGLSLALSFLTMGAYLIAEQSTNPLQAPSLGVPLAAFLITTALALSCCLLRPWTKRRHGAAELPPGFYGEERDVTVAATASGIRNSQQISTAVRYVDHARIYMRRDAGITREESPESTVLPGSAGDAVRAQPQ